MEETSIELDDGKLDPKRKLEDGQCPVHSLEKFLAMADVVIAKEKQEESRSAKKIKA